MAPISQQQHMRPMCCSFILFRSVRKGYGNNSLKGEPRIEGEDKAEHNQWTPKTEICLI